MTTKTKTKKKTTAQTTEGPEYPVFNPAEAFPYDIDTASWPELCGALFACVEVERRLVIGSNARSLAEMHLSQFVKHPGFVSPKIMDLHIHHAARLKKRRNVQTATLIRKLAGHLPALPTMTTPTQRTEIHAAYWRTTDHLYTVYSGYQQQWEDYKAKKGTTKVDPGELDSAPDDPKEDGDEN
jgi:CRISPR-associated protein (Cas_Csd1)